ncbi:recombinase-like helix-turn-helix domain-containing protein [Halomonas halocynthiae]|uniref:recombinase-like helix-turn-helix domain-containing protein n=1 Tax=Halomonas halocynthiae TaxID=176290 RepID=UPI000421E542|nr:recombinase-like helix-turn-helix domain-containing protein [Halomonas halocynthiae]
MSDSDLNPQLKTWARVIPSSEPGKGRIEQPGGFDNRVWQTRERAAEPFELELVAALEEVFESGATELPQVIAGLKERHRLDRQGNPWNEESFLKEMAVLGH